MSTKTAEKAAPVEAVEEQDFTPCRDQGVSAKVLGLTREDCPYVADGPLRDAWMAGFDAE
jgi:hypothetical protein